MQLFSTADRFGSLDGRSTQFYETLFLLDKEYRIIGVRPSLDSCNLPSFRLGDAFFQIFPTTQDELRTLHQLCAGPCKSSLLMRAGQRPVLMLCSFCRETSLLVAAIPSDSIARRLDAPAGYQGILHRVILSNASLGRHGLIDESDDELVTSWIRLMQMPLFIVDDGFDSPEAVTTSLIRRTTHLAQLFDCHILYDFRRFSYDPSRNYSLSTFTGSLIVILMAAQRLSADHTVKISCENHPIHGGLVSAFFKPAQSELEPLELQSLCNEARWNGRFFQISHIPESPFPLRIDFSFCTRELSHQGIKDPLADSDHTCPPIPIPQKEAACTLEHADRGIPLFSDHRKPKAP